MDFEWGFAPNPAKGTESLMINPSETPCMTKEKEILLNFFPEPCNLPAGNRVRMSERS